MNDETPLKNASSVPAYPTGQNPYASPLPVADGGLYERRIEQIPLGDRVIKFSGTVTRQDVVGALPRTTGRLAAGIVLGTILIFLGVVGTSQLTIGLLIGVAMIIWGLSFTLWRSSRYFRAARLAKQHPKTFRPGSGWIRSDRIRIENIHGWSELTWKSIAGLRVDDLGITLALNPQHAAFLFLPRRFFEIDDWPVIQDAVEQVADRLPYQPRPLQFGDSSQMVGKITEPLDQAPQDSIWIDGQFLVSEYMRSPIVFGYYRSYFIWIMVTNLVALYLTMSFGGFEDFPPMKLLFWLLPALLMFRLVRFVRSGWNQKPIISIQAAVSDQCIWLATPRSISMTLWSGFGDAQIGKNIILLRETPHSIIFVPLPLAALKNPSQWDSLVAMVRRNIRAE